jgi:cytochrome c-type biogenesis protein CcmE
VEAFVAGAVKPSFALPAPADPIAHAGLRYWLAMNPSRKRTVRLVVALSAAVVLATALIYTSFSAASPALSPSQLLRQAAPGRSYQLTGTVAPGSVHREGAVLDFSVEDRAGGGASKVALAYTGVVPDPFREGREVIVTVEKQGGRYIGEANSLITKCPSKYKTAPPSENQNS